MYASWIKNEFRKKNPLLKFKFQLQLGRVHPPLLCFLLKELNLDLKLWSYIGIGLKCVSISFYIVTSYKTVCPKSTVEERLKCVSKNRHQVKARLFFGSEINLSSYKDWILEVCISKSDSSEIKTVIVSAPQKFLENLPSLVKQPYIPKTL